MEHDPWKDLRFPDLGKYFPLLSVPRPSDLSRKMTRSSDDFIARHQLLAGTGPGEVDPITLDGSIYSAAWPKGDPEIMKLFIESMHWYSIFDEWVEKTTHDSIDTLNGRLFVMLDILNGHSRPTATGFAAALEEIITRSREQLVPELHMEVRAALHGVLIGWLWEAHHRATRTYPSLATYLCGRPYLGGGTLLHAFAESLSDGVLADDARRHPDFLAVKDAYINIVMWTNDLYSYTRERRDDKGIPISLPGLLIRERGLTLDQAFQCAGDMLHDEARKAVAALDTLATSPIPAMRDYAETTRHTMAVNAYFYTTWGRKYYAVD